MLQRFLHGDDIFISYSRADASLYATSLADELTKAGYSCFLDQLGTDPDVNLPSSLTHKIRGCTVCVLLGTERALQSKAVAKEIEEFKTTKRTIIPVYFVDAPEDKPLYKLIPGLARATETSEALVKGDPSANVIKRIKKSFNYTRRNKRLGRMAAAAATLLLLLLAGGVAAGAYAASQLREAQRQQSEANLQKGFASLSTADAALARFNAEEQKRQAELERQRATEQSQIAERNKAEADKQQQLAQAKAEEARKQSEIARAKTEEAKKQTEIAEAQKKEADKQTEIARVKTEEARVQTERARVEQAKADAQATASTARSRLDADPEQSVLLAVNAAERIRAAGIGWQPQVDEALRLSLASSHARALLSEKGFTGHFDSYGEGPASRRIDTAMGVAVSDDGRLIVTSSSKSKTRVWDARTGELKATLEDNANNLAFSPDAKFVYMANNGNLYAWDWSKPEEPNTIKPFPSNEGKVSYWEVSFGAGGHMLTASGNVVVLRDARDGKALATHEQSGGVLKTGFSPDGKFFYTLSVDRELKTIDVWDTGGGHLARMEAGESDAPIVLGPEARRIAKVGPDGVELWDVKRGVKVATLKEERKAFEFSGDGRRIVTTGKEGAARVWDAETGEPIAELTGHDGKVLSAAFSRDGRYVLTTGDDGKARLWDLATGMLVLELRGHAGPVKLAKFFSSDGDRIVTLSDDGTGRVWDTEVGRRPVTEFKYGGTVSSNIEFPRWASFGPDGKTVVIVGAKEARSWDTATGRQLPGKLGPAGAEVIGFSDDGRLTLVWTQKVVNGEPERDLKVYEMGTGREISTLRGAVGIGYARFDRKGERVVVWAVGQANVWEVKTGNLLQTINTESPRKELKPFVYDAAYSPDGQLLALATATKVELWDTRAWRNVLNLPQGGSKRDCYSVAFSPDGTMIAIGIGTSVQIWTVGGEMLKSLLPPENRRNVWSMAFSHDGTLFAASSEGGFTQVWDVKTWQTARVLPQGLKPTYRLAFTPDDATLMTVSGDGLVRLYPREMFVPYDKLFDLVPQRVTGRPLTEDERQRFLPQQAQAP